MYCNKDIHDELSKTIYIQCPFCNKDLQSYQHKPEDCCGNQDLIEVDYRILHVCRSCGQTNNETFAQGWVDFYENRYRIYKKSIYLRNDHNINVLHDISLKNDLPISRAIINHVCQTFDLINTILRLVNRDRRRIISIKFIIHKLFEMWNLPCMIPISKSNKTLNYHEGYWSKIH